MVRARTADRYPLTVGLSTKAWRGVARRAGEANCIDQSEASASRRSASRIAVAAVEANSRCALPQPAASAASGPVACATITAGCARSGDGLRRARTGRGRRSERLEQGRCRGQGRVVVGRPQIEPAPSPVRTASAAFIPPISPAASTALRNALMPASSPATSRPASAPSKTARMARALRLTEAEMQPAPPAASPWRRAGPPSSGRRPAGALRRSPQACCRTPRRCPCRRPPGPETERSAGRRVPAIPARRSSAGCDRGSPSAQGRRPSRPAR